VKVKTTILMIIGLVVVSISWGKMVKAEEPQKIVIKDKIRIESKMDVVPGQLLIGTKKKTEVVSESEISMTIPLINKKFIFREAGIGFKGMAEATATNKELKINEAEVIDLSSLMNQGDVIKVKLAGVDMASLEMAMAEYKKDPNVEFVEPVYVVRAMMTPNDEYYQYQWNMKMIKMESAWDKVANGGSRTVKVAVIDTGVQKTPELTSVPFDSPKHFQSYDCATQEQLPTQIIDTNVTDNEGHGTHVASTIAQSTNNGNHAAGVAYGVTLIPVKVLSCDWGGATVDTIAGINHAVASGAKVINMSLGGPATGYSIAERQAIKAAVNQGVTVVIATGNSALRASSPAIGCPACMPEAIAVGAVRYDSIRAMYSQYTPDNITDAVNGNIVNRGVDVVAPGGQMINDVRNAFLDANSDQMPDGILQQTIVVGSNPLRYTSVTDFNADFGLNCISGSDTEGYGISENCGLLQGTSMSTPHVTGLVALMYSLKSNITPDQVKSILKSTAMKSFAGYSQLEYGAGIIDAAAALEAVKALNPATTVTPTSTKTPTPTATKTPNLTPTATKTPTGTPPVSVSVTPTKTPTITPTAGPTATPVNCLPCPTGMPEKKFGNADCNSAIDMSDYQIWRTEYLQSRVGGGSGLGADFSGPNGGCDGKVDLYDFATWKDSYLQLKH